MRLLRLLLLATALFVAVPADASVSIAVGFDALVKDADGVAIVTPTEAKSVWEEGRIITYTKVKIDQNVAGEATAGKEAWVRTLGGVVGKIGQLVDGEPVFSPNKQTLLFLHKFTTNGTFEVSARAQGQFPVVVDESTKAKKLMRAGSLGVVLPPKNPEIGPAPRLRLAAEVIHDRPVDDAVKEIADAWKKAHAK